MAEVNFYLRDNKTDKKTAVILFVSYNNKRVKVASVEHIEPKFWDNTNQRAKQTKAFPTYPEFNTRLKKIKDASLDAYRRHLNDNEQKQPSTDLIKELIKDAINFESYEPEKINYNFLSFTEKFIDDSESGDRVNKKTKARIQPNTIKVYKTFKKNLEEFKKAERANLNFDRIDLDFFKNFTKWMIKEKDYKTNSLAKHIKIFKVIMNEAFKEKLTSLSIKNDDDYNASSGEQPDTIYLNKDELEKLYKLDLSNNGRLEKVRDLFLVGCWSGFRFSDFSNIKSSDIQNGYFVKKTQKTSVSVSVPIHPILIEIMEKYKGKTENSLPPSISNQKMNLYVKEICKMAEIDETIHLTYLKGNKTIIKEEKKYNLVSSHSARRSFASNMYLNGNPITRIMAITGHKSEINFRKYLRITSREHAEQLIF